MPASPVKVGPFVGGMNTYSGPSAIGDNEAVEITNMEIDLDGSLASRPGINEFNTVPVAGKVGIVVGTYRSLTNVFYIIYSFETEVWALNTGTAAWTKITNADITDCVQYGDKLWLVFRPSGASTGGGKWDPTGGFAAVAAMPRGYSCTVYKERMFVAASRNADQTSINRVKFSNAANFDTWTGTDYFDVSSGDGQDIQKLTVFDNAIVIFKSDSTYVFSYDTQVTKGVAQAVSMTIGLNNNYCAVEYENNLFVLHEANVFRISNWNWELANVKLPFEYKNSKSLSADKGSSLSVMGNRIVARYYDNVYVLGTKTGAWSVWKWNDGTMLPTNFLRDPNVDTVYGASNYYAGSYDTSKTVWYRFTDQFNNLVRSESYTTRLITKAYDYGPSYAFKRLFWWGVDLLAKSSVTFRVSPVVYSVPVTWGQLIGVPFSQLKTWGRPLDLSIDVSDSANIGNALGNRTFIKLLKSLRFRQVQFILESTQDGTPNTGPLRIFSITAFVDAKETVTKKVS